MTARKSFIIMVSQAISAVMGLLALFLVSKLWGSAAPNLMGVVWFGMAFVGSFSFITDLGFNAAHVKRVSEGKDLSTCIGTFIAIKLILIAIMVICVVGGIAFWKYCLNNDFYDATKESVIYIFLGYYVFFGLAQIPLMTFNSRKEIAKSQLSTLMDPIIRVPLMIIVAMAGVTAAFVSTDVSQFIITVPAKYAWPSFLQSAQTFLANHAIGAFASAYMFGAFAMFLVSFSLMRKYPIKRMSREYAMSYLKFSIPLMIPMMFTLLVVNIDKVMLGFFWTSTEVGYYSSVQRITNMLLMISTSLGIILLPTISSIYSKKHISRKRRIRKILSTTRKSERYSSMVITPLVALIVVFSVPIIDIALNSSFRPASQSLQLLAIYTLIVTLNIPFRSLIVGRDRPGLFARVVIMGGVANIVLNYLLIPSDGLLSDFGITGPSAAAIAALASAAIMLVGFRHYSRKIIKRPFFQNCIAIHLAASFVMGAAIWYLGTLFDQLRWYHLGLLSLMGFGLYFSILWAVREFRKEDYRLFIDTVNPGRIFKYMRSEIKGK